MNLSEKQQLLPARLKTLRRRLGKNQADFAEMVMLSRPYLSELESGKRKFQPWLVDRLEALEMEFGPISDKELTFRETGSHYQSGRRVALDTAFPHQVPVVSWAAAGSVTTAGNYADLEDMIEERLVTDCRDPNAYALILEGDSMLPEFKPGDRVIFEPNREAQNGDCVCARVRESGQVFFKLFHLDAPGKRARLTSFNPAYPAIEFPLKAFRFIHPMHSVVRKWKR